MKYKATIVINSTNADDTPEELQEVFESALSIEIDGEIESVTVEEIE